jgi:hypothetical protein
MELDEDHPQESQTFQAFQASSSSPSIEVVAQEVVVS